MKSVSVILLLGALYALETIQCATVYVVDFQFFFLSISLCRFIQVVVYIDRVLLHVARYSTA